MKRWCMLNAYEEHGIINCILLEWNWSWRLLVVFQACFLCMVELQQFRHVLCVNYLKSFFARNNVCHLRYKINIRGWIYQVLVIIVLSRNNDTFMLDTKRSNCFTIMWLCQVYNHWWIALTKELEESKW